MKQTEGIAVDIFYFIRIFLGTMMIATAVLKLLSFNSFQLTVRQLNLVVMNAAFTVSGVIAIEMLSGILMFFDATYLGGSLLIVLLSLCFIGVAMRSKKLPGTITCNCFGSLIPENLGNHTIHRALVLIALTVLVVIMGSGYSADNQVSVYPIALSVLQSLAIIALYGNIRVLFSKPE
ncbi:MauE/DoxX family redox-associated membrane protein [Paenibacillus sp. SYP-B4298]|uniref:MauE/DoxX family redox-associated membrane protein n=1 Tax=Paenibacillus sp. SYP-B4298 TaxID=2996034 RepID=UPI0022DD58D0|nr:MauE/DoxX family redox-associated membrane protein [Paenibacillus sp. SYP-B4298]